jgi:CHAT domain-containing protein/Tfp pilus assembly protein PilF
MRLVEIVQQIDQLMNDGSNLYQEREIQEALECYQEAQDILENIREQIEQMPNAEKRAIEFFSAKYAVTLNNIGSIYDSQNDFTQALEYYEKALFVYESITSVSVEIASCFNSIAGIYRSTSNWRLALEYYNKSLAIDEENATSSVDIATRLNNIGFVYQNQGDFARALDCYYKALVIDEAIGGNSTQIAIVLNNIGLIYRYQGDLVNALEYFQKSLVIDQVINAVSMETATDLNNIGFVYRSQGDLVNALKYFQQALVILEKEFPKSKETAASLNNVGIIYHSKSDGDLFLALEYYKRALLILELSAPNSSEIAGSLRNIGAVYYALDDFGLALEYYEKALSIAENLRRSIGSHRAAEYTFISKLGSIYSMFSCYEKQTQEDKGIHSYASTNAFDLAERVRAKTMSDRLAEKNLTIVPKNKKQQKLLEQQKQVHFDLAHAYDRKYQVRQNIFPNTAVKEKADRDIQELERLQDDLYLALRRDFPEYATIEYPKPLTLTQTQQEILTLNTALLAFFRTDKKYYLWIVHQNNNHMIPLPSTLEEMRDKVSDAVGGFHLRRPAKSASQKEWHQFQAAVEAREILETVAMLWLSKTLLRFIPVHFWEGIRRLLIIPDGILHYLPFEMLPWTSDDGDTLGDAYSISYAPSTTVLHNLRTLRENRPVPAYGAEFVAFGDPGKDYPPFNPSDAPARPDNDTRRDGNNRILGTREEIHTIAEQFTESQRRIFLGKDATERRAITETEDAKYLHFATHGSYDSEQAMGGYLDLAAPQVGDNPEGQPIKYDDKLSVQDIINLRLTAEMVVCSACVTGLGQVKSGEGMEGMSRAFLYAGAKCVLVTLWPVSDAHMPEYMEHLYTELRTGKTVADALFHARKKMRAAYDDPYIWAPLIAVGLAHE